jgi:decaprenylphospho-beta-D-ribofuranose 2-oxidase
MPSTSPEPPRPPSRPTGPVGPALRRRELTGWGSTAATAALVAEPTSPTDLARSLDGIGPRGAIARGLGRSYGDSAQNAGGRVIETTGVRDFHLDEATGVVRASAGASLDALMRDLVPRGWFVPVTPGTRYVTVGGAVAADIHGKNHHRGGSWCNHVLSLTLALPDGSQRVVSPTDDPDVFWATAGGMGLTGVVLEATFQCKAIETSRLLVDTDRTADLDEVMALMDSTDDDYEYSVAWIDLSARGRSMGRSVLGRGRFATADEVSAGSSGGSSGGSSAGPSTGSSAGPSALLDYDAGILVSAPPVFPSGLLNRTSIRILNEAWYRKAPRRRHDELQSIPAFFHPLDMIGDWNRVYGTRGFLQWQYAVPFGAEETVRHTVDRLSATGSTSFVSVLKRFGQGNQGHLSFPAPGWTLSLDIPVGVPGLGPLLDQLDERIVEAGGRVYLAKDSRVRAEHLAAMYPRLDEWRAIRERLDPHRRLQSDQARRLHLV